MDRRRFLKTTGIVSALAATSTNTFAQTISSSEEKKNLIDPELIEKIRSRIVPISPEERSYRIEKAQKLMGENKMDFIFMEGGTSLDYFTGVRWGRSERVFGMLLPKNGAPVFISPKFEETRAKEQIGNAKLYCWEEHENPFALMNKIIKEYSSGAGAIGMEETTRFFITQGLKNANINLNITSATPVTASCRGIKTEHEIELMQIANDMAMEVYKVAVTQLKEGMTEGEYGKIISDLFAESGVG